MPSLADLKIQIYADGADFAQMVGLSHHPLIKGFTTNPTACLKAGVTDYEGWIRDVLRAIPDKPISFEVLADDLKEMERQARKLASFGPNVYVKIPAMTTAGGTTRGVTRALLRAAVRINVTAIMSTYQVAHYKDHGTFETGDCIVSIFAGRIADTGVYAASQVGQARMILPDNVKVLWASTRELFNIFEAEEEAADIITLTMDQIKKFDLIGKDLTEYSRETVQQFYNDGQRAGLLL